MSDLDLNAPDVQEAIKKAAEEMVKQQNEGLVQNRDQLIKEKRELQDKIKQFDGIDPDKVREMLKLQEDADNERLRKEKDFDALLEKQAEKMRGEITARDSNIEALTTMLKSEKIESVAMKAITDNKGVPDLLMPHLKSRVRLDDEFNVEVLSREGTPMFTGEGKRAGIGDLVNEYKKDPVFARAFDANVNGGTGARSTGNSNVGGDGVNPFERDKNTGRFDLSAASELRKKDPQRAKALATEAGIDTSTWS